MSDHDAALPPYALLARHSVADFDRWKQGFDDHQPVREAAGLLGHHINRGESDPDLITIYFAVSDLDRARAFTRSDDLKAIMKEVGVTSAPEFTWMTPQRESVVWDRQLPAMLITHTVADFDAWLEGYNGADDLRVRKGIVGHAANRSLDEPATAVVYHQAESFDDLRSFLADPELEVAMKDAGVTSAPETTFHMGGWSQQY